VSWSWSFLQSEGNPMVVRELGLYSGSTLVARKVLPAQIAKDEHVKLTGTWTLYW
jgi:hypothetical protein